MRTKHYFTALALPLVFAACSNDDLDVNNTPELNGPKLSENFSFTADIIGQDADTRIGFEDGINKAFSWLPQYANEDNGAKTADELIGVCLIGGVDEISNPSGKVFTNYPFKLKGWMNPEGGIESVDVPASVGAGNTTLAAWRNAQSDQWLKDPEGMTKGNFVTCTTPSPTLMAGDYVIYYPHDAEFNSIKQLPIANYNSVQTAATVTKDGDYAHIPSTVFAVSEKTTLAPGTETSSFKLYFMNYLLGFKMYKGEGELTKSIKRIIVEVKDGTQFPTEGTVNALNHSFVASTENTTESLVLTLGTGSGVSIADGTEVAPYLTAMTMLPVNLSGKTIVIKVVPTDGTKVAIYEKNGTNFVASKYGQFSLPIVDADFNKDMDRMVFTADEFKAEAAKGGVIKLMDDVTITEMPSDVAHSLVVNGTKKLTINTVALAPTADWTFNCPVEIAAGLTTADNHAITFNGKVEVIGGNITVTTGTLNINGKGSSIAATAGDISIGDTLNVNDEITIGKSITLAANKAAANLNADGIVMAGATSGTATGALNINANVINNKLLNVANMKLTIAAGKTLTVDAGRVPAASTATLEGIAANTVVLNGTLDVVKGEVTSTNLEVPGKLIIGTGSKFTNSTTDSTLKLIGTGEIVNNGTFTNEGTVMVNDATATFNNVGDFENGRSVVLLGQLNNAATDKFVNTASGSVSGKANFNGTYTIEVEVMTSSEFALANSDTKCGLIRLTGATTSTAAISTEKAIELGTGSSLDASAGPITFGDLTVTGNNVTTTGNVNVTNDVTINKSAKLTVSGGVLAVTGKVINNGTFAISSGRATCSGIAGTGTWTNYPEW